MGTPIFGTRYVLAPTPEGEEHPNVIDRFVKQEHFCDTHCVWTDHHPDCALAQPKQGMGLGVNMIDLRKAAQALVDRWDTPLWKDASHTGVFIDALRAALAQPEPCADESDCDYMPWCRIRKACQKQARAALAQPERKPLTEEEIGRVCAPLGFAQLSPVEIARAIEAAHGIE